MPEEWPAALAGFPTCASNVGRPATPGQRPGAIGSNNQYPASISTNYHLPFLMRKGTKVNWKYGTGTATGKIESVHKEPVVRTIKGAEIHRNGSAADPALVIVQDNGDRVLKLKSEVKATT